VARETLSGLIGNLRSVVLDCRDPHQLAAFYAEMLGGKSDAEDESWVVVTDQAGRRLAFQRSPAHEPPQFPDPRGSQQFHLDLQVDDVDEAERKVLALGATRVRDAVEDGSFRVFRDPAGHTFCLVWGVADPSSVVAAPALSGSVSSRYSFIRLQMTSSVSSGGPRQ
jgi:predicted enzyme related to lactoylglutathione lyase